MSTTPARIALGAVLAAAAHLALAVLPAPLAAQATRDTLRLTTLHADALRHDPRAAQLGLERRQSALRLRTLDTEHLPALTAEGQAQYQSDVVSIPITLPGGQQVPTPPHDTWDAHLAARERLLDPSLGARRAVERAQLARTQAETRVALDGVRSQVDQTFFDAALLQARADELAAAIADLEAQLQLARAHVRAGTALPGDTATLAAELLGRRQDAQQLDADRQAALANLGDLTGRAIDTSDVLALPDLAAEVARVRAASDGAWQRPEYAQFARTRDLLAAQADVASAELLPRLSAFARLGYGRPGLNFLRNTFEGYWLAGVQLQWTPWNWGATGREREALALQRDIVATEQASFTESLRRAATRDLATIDRLGQALATDERIIALREEAADETRLRFDEGVVTAAEYVNRQTDVLDARLARATHRVQLAQARAHYLTTLGFEVH